MTFLAPTFFWGFLALIPLAAIYFLKVRPRKRLTTAYFLWEKVLENKHTSSLFSRLRDLLSLLLMLLAFSAMVIAMVRPELASDTRKDLMILVDRSASMAAKSGGSTRLEQALREAKKIVRGMNGSQRAAVASAADALVFHSNLTDNPRDLIEALDIIQQSEVAFNPGALAGTQTGSDNSWTDSHRFLFFTDGCIAENIKLPDHVETVKVGEPVPNIGIIAADMQIVPGRTGLYYQLASTHTSAVEVDLVLKQDGTGTVLRIIPVTVKPGVNSAETLFLDGTQSGNWVLEIDRSDMFDGDNRAYLITRSRPPIDIGVESENPYFFEAAVSAFAGAGGFLRLVDKDPQLVISSGKAVDSAMSLVFQPQGEGPWWSESGKPVDVVPKVVLRDHPVVRMSDLSRIPFLGARELEAPDDALILVESDQGLPLVYQVRRGDRSAVVVNMDPLESELYYSAYFPVLVHSTATYLAGREQELAATYQTGDSIPVPGGLEDNAHTAVQPNGTSGKFTGTTYGPLLSTGFYNLKSSKIESTIAASLISPPDSLLDNSGFQASAKPVSSGRSPAYWLTLLAILLLVLESILYHRRKVG